VGLGILALSRIINSNKPAKTAALASPNMTNSIWKMTKLIDQVLLESVHIKAIRKKAEPK
jgi:hypothetical protein